MLSHQDVGASVTSTQPTIPLYDVARSENLSPEHLNNDAPPPAYDFVRQEHMGPQYETVEAAKTAAVKVQEVTIIVEAAPEKASLEPPPPPPPMIRADSESPSLPPPYDPAVDRSDNEESVAISLAIFQEKFDESQESVQEGNSVNINVEVNITLSNCYDEVQLPREQERSFQTNDTEHSGHNDESTDKQETKVASQVSVSLFLYGCQIGVTLAVIQLIDILPV